MPTRPRTKNIEKVEEAVLRTFKKEIPSIHFSDKSDKEYQEWVGKHVNLFQYWLHFPPKMFDGCSLIDFGAGTGENTIQFANWGAKCTLIEMNDESCAIARKVFEQYSGNPDEHHIICTSLFGYNDTNHYDIVFSNGVLHHTDDKEGAFAKIASYVKPGGYLILGIGNKVGGFQNMIQRMILFKYAGSEDDIVDLAEALFKEDIDRSQKFSKRSRRSMIYDRFIVPKQDDPTVSEVLQWFSENNFRYYSSYPPVLLPVLSDSDLNPPTFKPQAFVDIGAFSEAFWMVHKNDDIQEIPKILESLSDLSRAQFAVSDIVNDFNPDSSIDIDLLLDGISNYQQALNHVDLSGYIRRVHKEFFGEVKELLNLLKIGTIEDIGHFIRNTNHLFRGANGLRHMFFIAHRPC